MLKSLGEVSPTRRRIEIEIPADSIEKQILDTLKSYQQNMKLPGFRPGKIPLALVDKKYGRSVEAEVLEKMVQEEYMTAIKESGLIPVSQPKLENEGEFKRNENLLMAFLVDVLPVIENLNYDDITVKSIPITVEDADITTLLEKYVDEKSVYEPVEDDKIGMGDLVTFDVKFHPEKTFSQEVLIKIGSGSYPKEFFDLLVGKQKNDSFTADVSFTNETPPPFSGKTGIFEIRIKEVKRRAVMPIDNELARDLGHDDLEALRRDMKERLLSSREREVRGKMHRQIADVLIERHMFESPVSLVESATEELLAERRASGQPIQDEEELKAQFRPLMEKKVRLSIILDKIADKEKISVTDEEIGNEITILSQVMNAKPDDIVKFMTARDGSLMGLQKSIRERKVLNLLVDRAVVENGGTQ